MSSSPATMRRSVDLPLPEGPTKTRNSPCSTFWSTWRITGMPLAQVAWTERSSMPALVSPGLAVYFLANALILALAAFSAVAASDFPINTD